MLDVPDEMVSLQIDCAMGGGRYLLPGRPAHRPVARWPRSTPDWLHVTGAASAPDHGEHRAVLVRAAGSCARPGRTGGACTVLTEGSAGALVECQRPNPPRRSTSPGRAGALRARGRGDRSRAVFTSGMSASPDQAAFLYLASAIQKTP